MNRILLIVLAIILPPVAVGLAEGITFHFWLNIILVLLGCIGAPIHALYLVLTRDYEIVRK